MKKYIGNFQFVKVSKKVGSWEEFSSYLLTPGTGHLSSPNKYIKFTYIYIQKNQNLSYILVYR